MNREISEQEIQKLAIAGHELTATAAVALEETVREDPNNTEGRISLLGFYFTRTSLVASYAGLRLIHVAWFVQNQPAHLINSTPFVATNYNQDGVQAITNLSELWLQQIQRHPGDIKVINNATTFFFRIDRNIADELLQTANALTPNKAHLDDGLRCLHHWWSARELR